jgi:hypothetical protein
MVLFGRRRHVGLVLQRALTQGEPHGDEVLLHTAEADVPPSFARFAPIDRGNHGIVLTLLFEPLGDEYLGAVQFFLRRERVIHQSHRSGARVTRSA